MAREEEVTCLEQEENACEAREGGTGPSRRQFLLRAAGAAIPVLLLPDSASSCCATSCEGACQDPCQSMCETTCELACQTCCEVFWQNPCYQGGCGGGGCQEYWEYC